MNYLETGLPHTDFSPRKTNFRPPRYIPLCSLGRKYLGLEPLTRDEVQKIISRLCQPKHRKQEQECEVRSPREDEPRTNSNRRFVGRKRMSSLEIEKMVERLYNKRKTKDFQFVDNTFDAKDFINMTDRDDSDDENNEDEVFFSNTECEQGKKSSRRLNCFDKDIVRVMRPNDDTNHVMEDTCRLVTENKTENPNVIDRRRTSSRENCVFINSTGTSLQRRQTFTASNGHEIPFKIAQRNSVMNEKDEPRSDHFIQNKCFAETQNLRNGRVEPCMFRTTIPWSKRTETVGRQVNSVRRPLSNPIFETSQQMLNIRKDRSPRLEYAVTRCASSLPRLQTRQRANNSQTLTEDMFIEQVATSNTPRGR